MKTSAPVIDRVKELAAAGLHADVVAELKALENDEVQDSPFLSLIYGSAQARLGRPGDGLKWVERALSESRKCGDRDVEKRALNVRGGIGLVAGRIDEAADYFTQAMLAGSSDGDLFTIGRASNNLGIVSNLRGRQAEALGSYEMAIAAFERAGLRRGVAQCRHNLSITYREQGLHDQSLEQAELAIAAAEALGDAALAAQSIRGRAEARVARGELKRARADIETALEALRRLDDPIEEAEALRVVASIQAADGRLGDAEATLRDVIARAESHEKLQLIAEATADLALVLRRADRVAEAREAGRTAHALFSRLGAEGELRKLAGQDWEEEFSAELHRMLEPLHEAQGLADRGRYAELLTYLGERTTEELEQSPTLAVLFGIAHARLGRLDVGHQWAMVALSRARVLGDRPLELRALNVCGAVALERGGLHEATHFFARAQEQALEDSDLVTLGRCANNLGIIANLQGDYGRAVGAYTRAIAAYQQAQYGPGLAESHHNMGITYREMARLDEALQAAGTAMREADRLGDRRLRAQALAGRAEIRLARKEPELARREAERALAIHRELQDAVLETEDLRILAGALAAMGHTADAEAQFRDVIERAAQHTRPLLVAITQRDLAVLLAGLDRDAEALELTREARVTFDRLRADQEIRKLDAFVATLEAAAR
ncbi:MAG: tetratricopeptide repeat protein [Gemmatimonadota bacterium]|nr:tetratricopeptide repeat protein [Gemmatimonadota bacterium]